MTTKIVYLLFLIGSSLIVLHGCGETPAQQRQRGARPARAAQSQPAERTRAPSPASEAIPVTVAPVLRQPIASYLEGTATLESEEIVQVLAEAAGRTTQLAVEEGDWVKRGQILAELDDREARLALARAKVQLAEAKTAFTSLVRLDQREAELALRNAELAATEALGQYHRAEAMAQRGLISQEELDTARTQRETADVTMQQEKVRLEYKTIDDAHFRHEQAKTTLQEAELRLQYTTVKAPITGVISQRQVVRGQFVQQNQHLFTIIDTRHVLARTFLPEKFSGSLALGQPAYIEVEALPQQRFEARVKLISPVVEADSGTFKVTVEVSKPSPGLKPGMFANVFIAVATHAEALVVPKRALLLDNAQPIVYRLQNGRARRVTLTIGLTDNEWVQVLSGLAENEQVIVVGQDKLLDDMAVQVMSDDG